MSGFYYPNSIVRDFLLAMEDVMGHNGVSAVLNLAGMHDWVGHYPPDDLEPSVDFGEFSAINGTLMEMYGPRGGRALARRSAWVTFSDLLKKGGAFAELTRIGDQNLSVDDVLSKGLPALVAVMDQLSDQTSEVRSEADHYVIRLERCPVCWGRKSSEPTCHAIVGLLEEYLRWLSNGTAFEILETRCMAMGDAVCEFQVGKKPF